MNRRIVRKSATELVQYQLKLVQRIEHGKPVTYPGYAHIKPKSPRPTILTEGMIGEVRSYKGVLKSARGYISRLNKEVLPAPWEDIEGVVITEHRGFGKAKAFPKGGMARGPRKMKDTTLWLSYLDKEGDEHSIDPQTKQLR